MKVGYRKLIVFCLTIILILLTNTFIVNFLSNIRLVFLLLIFLFFFNIIFKFEKNHHRYVRDILFEILLFVLLYFILFYLLGLVVGISKTPNYLNIVGLKNYIIPVILYSIFRELFRYNLLSKADGSILCTVFVVLLMIILDLTNRIYYASFNSNYEILKFIALVLLPTISKNISYSYITKKCGYNPVIIFDLIFSLYPYLLPYIPNPNEYIMSIILLVVPILFAFRVDKYFKMKSDVLLPSNYHKKEMNGVLLPFLIIIILVYFFSGYFRFYAIAIASASMSPGIRKGDIVIIDQNSSSYDVGDVIAFKHNDSIIVHRIIKKITVDNNTVYYTKGDANNKPDNYILEEDYIIGKTNVRIPYIGYPTVWFNEL